MSTTQKQQSVNHALETPAPEPSANLIHPLSPAPETEYPTHVEPSPKAPEQEALKSFARALMVSLTWSLAGLSTAKRGKSQ